MHPTSVSMRAFMYALVVAVTLLGALYYFRFVEFHPLFDSEEFQLSVMLFGIAVLTVLVYQSIRVSVSATTLARGMAEHMLLYSRELFTELYRKSPVPYLVIAQNGTVESVNLAALRLFGVGEGWLEGKPIFPFFEGHDETRAGLIGEYFKNRVPVTDEEYILKRPDGTNRWVLVSLFSFQDSTRHHKGLLTLVDITKQKQIDIAKTEFVSLASHQLRTPISAMKWNLELFQTAGESHLLPVQREYIEKIQNGLVRMDALVTDFLSVAKLELGTFVPTIETIDWKRFLGSVLTNHETSAQVRHVHLEVEEGGCVELRADPHLLEMALSNVISNAIKYTPEGGSVYIRGIETDVYTIQVTDTGIGIPKDEHERIFSKIFRASNAKARVAEGTGLGLYIVREAIRVMGGDVTFTSEVDQGTTFTIVLPKQ